MVILRESLTNKIIEEKRQEMIKLAQNYGYTSHLAVQASQELDSLLNAFSSNSKLNTFLS